MQRIPMAIGTDNGQWITDNEPATRNSQPANLKP